VPAKASASRLVAGQAPATRRRLRAGALPNWAEPRRRRRAV